MLLPQIAVVKFADAKSACRKVVSVSANLTLGKCEILHPGIGQELSCIIMIRRILVTI